MTDQENFYRVSSIIVDHGKEVLIILLDNDLSNQKLSFEFFLNQHQHEIYHLHYVNKNLRCCQCPTGSSPHTPPQRVLHADQLDILLDKHGQKLPCHCILSTRPYCCSLAKPSVTTKDLDITLARCLLVNFSKLCSPGSPIRHSVEVIVDYRNKLYGHAREAKISASDFQNNVANVETAILTIAKVCNVEYDMKQKLQDTKTRSLDQTLCIQYQNLLLQEMGQKAEIEENISVIKEQSELMMSQMQINQIHIDDQFQKHLQETTSMFSDFRKTQEVELKEIAEVLVDRGEDSKRQIQADIQGVNFYEDLKADMQVLLKTRIDSLEMHIDEQHDKLRTRIDKTELKAVTSITDTRNVMKTNMDEYETRLHHHIEDAMLQAAKTTLTDQKKQNIVAQANSLLISHMENKCYVVPNAVQAGLALLDKHSILIIISKGGEGKTTTALQLTSVYKYLGYIPYWFVDQDIKQFRDIIDPNDKCIIIMDDLFGRGYAKFDENVHKNILDILYAIVNNSQEVKLVFTINTDNDCLQSILTKHDILKSDFILDLDSKWQLSINEKKSIFTKYMESFKIIECTCHEGISVLGFYETNLREQTYCDNDVIELPNKTIQMCKGAISYILEMYLPTGFPETCRLFFSNPSLTLLGTRYFENPNQSLIDKIDDLYIEGLECKIARYQYCLLVYTALKGHIELEDAENKLVNDAFFNDLFSVFEDSSLKLKRILMEALKNLKGKFLELNIISDSGIIKDALLFKHQAISDAVLLSYGKGNTSQVLEKFDLEFIYVYIRPNTSERKKRSQTLYVPDNVICDRFKQILKMEQTTDDLYLNVHTATDIGKYIRRIEIEEKNSAFMKTFFELVPISFFESDQVKDLFDGLTHHGKHCKIIHSYLDKFGRYIWKHGSSNLIYSLCRPQSSIVDHRKFVLCPDGAMVIKLLSDILSHDKKYKTSLVDLGEYLYTLSREENHHFVISFLSKIWDKRSSYETRLIIGGFTKEGERGELIPAYRIIFAHFIPWNCSINVILKFCKPSTPGEDCNDQVLLVDRGTLINQLTIKFRECLFGLHLDYHRCISRERQVEDIGRNCYIFLFTVKDKTFLGEVVGAFVTVIQQKFSVEIPLGLEINYRHLIYQDPTLASSFFDGLTNFGEHLQTLREKFPKLIENLERYTSFYRSIKKIQSSNYLFDL